MTFRIRGILRWFALVAFLAGCSQERSAGGGGFEGETVSVTGRILLNGRALVDADVAFISMSTGATLQRTSTDDSGAFELRVPTGATGFLEARAGDSALLRTMLESLPTTRLDLLASRPIAWNARATVAGLPATGAVVHEVGSAIRATCDAEGRFTLPRLGGSGHGTIVAVLPDGDVRTASLPSLSDSLVDFSDHPQLLLDDFDDGDARSTLGSAIGSGWWYALDDAGEGGASAILPAEAISDIRQAITSIDAWSGNSLSLRFLIDEHQPVYYGIVGNVVTDGTWWLDASTIDSITFMAKGSGSVRMDFVARVNLEPSQDTVGYYGATVTLPSTWTRMVVRASDIRPMPGSRADLQGMAWSTAAREIQNIAFTAKDTVNLQVDDIVLHGPILADLNRNR